jgi:hypothetical protein
MENDKVKNSLDSFLSNRVSKTTIDNKTEEVCDLQTGECYTIKTKDGLVERLNKKYVIEDGRQLIID